MRDANLLADLVRFSALIGVGKEAIEPPFILVRDAGRSPARCSFRRSLRTGPRRCRRMNSWADPFGDDLWPVADFMGAFEIAFYGWKEGAGHKFYGPNNATDLWHVKKVNPQSMVLLTEKPVELAVRAMQYSSLTGENVPNLFGGSGLMLIAAEQAGRNAYLTELDTLHCDVIVQRWGKVVGREAECIAAATCEAVSGEDVVAYLSLLAETRRMCSVCERNCVMDMAPPPRRSLRLERGQRLVFLTLRRVCRGASAVVDMQLTEVGQRLEPMTSCVQASAAQLVPVELVQSLSDTRCLSDVDDAFIRQPEFIQEFGHFRRIWVQSPAKAKRRNAINPCTHPRFIDRRLREQSAVVQRVAAEGDRVHARSIGGGEVAPPDALSYRETRLLKKPAGRDRHSSKVVRDTAATGNPRPRYPPRESRRALRRNKPAIPTKENNTP